MFGKALSLANDIAAFVGGKVKPGGSFFNWFAYVVKATWREMRLEVFVANRAAEIYVTNFSSKFDAQFIINRQTLSLTEAVNGVFRSLGVQVFAREMCNVDPIRRFGADVSNEEDVRNLQLGRGEYLMISANAIQLKFRRKNLDRLRPRLETLVRLFERNRIPGRLRIRDRRAYRIVASSASPPGVPLPEGHLLGCGASSVPECVNCARPLAVIARLDLKSPEIQFKNSGNRFLFAITCLTCDSHHAPIFYRCSDGFISLVHQERATPLDHGLMTIQPRALDLWPLAAESSADLPRPRHQLGGSPVWVQSEQRVHCRACGTEMAFVAQLDSDPQANLQFEDDGSLYVFICVDCQICASFAQGH